MINNVRNTVLYIANKENNGYITPDMFNACAKQAQLDIFEEYMRQFADASVKTNARLYGSGYADIMKRIENILDTFRPKPVPLVFASGSFALPSDVFKLEFLKYNGATRIDYLSHSKADILLSSNLTTPTVLYPVYTLNENEVTVYPSSIQTGVTADYIRYPADPKWTYITVGDAPLFNPAAPDYQDFELPLSDEMNLITRILQMVGISIREADLVAAAKSEELQDKQEQ